MRSAIRGIVFAYHFADRLIFLSEGVIRKQGAP